MRLSSRMFVVTAIAGLAVAACNNEDSPSAPPMAKVPQPAQVPQPMVAEISNPTLPTALDRDREPPSANDHRGPTDRVESIKTMLSKMESGHFEDAFAYLGDAIIWTEIGRPDGELTTVPEVVEFQRRARMGMSDFRLRARRIIDSADYQAVEFVWSARHTGPLADGRAATDKVATLPGAMLVHYQADGRIDRVWVFQDLPNVAQQLGLAPGLPADFIPVPFPETTDVVVGALDSSFASSYGTFASRMGRDVYTKALSEQTTDDFGVVNLRSGQLIKGSEAMLAYFGERVGSFDIAGTRVEAVMGAGEFFAAFVTHDYVYRGGFMGVAATDQKVVTHTLDVVRFDSLSLRIKSLATYGNSAEILSALGLGSSASLTPDVRLRGLVDSTPQGLADPRSQDLTNGE